MSPPVIKIAARSKKDTVVSVVPDLGSAVTTGVVGTGVKGGLVGAVPITYIQLVTSVRILDMLPPSVFFPHTLAAPPAIVVSSYCWKKTKLNCAWPAAFAWKVICPMVELQYRLYYMFRYQGYKEEMLGWQKQSLWEI
ncbi:hypothetical protein HY029_01565 [Candidatus Gottesmanbacteria bacterium]|nr:hypothetical protein [Candidatus Gottesmanbacteria bacterium]